MERHRRYTRSEGDEAGYCAGFDTRIEDAFDKAGIETVADVRRRLVEGTMLDVPGIGPGRLAAIEKSLGRYDAESLPPDDPTVQRHAIAVGAYRVSIDAITLAQLLEVDGHTEEARELRAVIRDVVRRYTPADGLKPGSVEYQEGWEVFHHHTRPGMDRFMAEVREAVA